MVSNPIGQPRVHLSHGGVLSWLVDRVALLLFDSTAPGMYIYAMTWCTIPPDQRAARGLHQWWIELIFAGDVAQHLR